MTNFTKPQLDLTGYVSYGGQNMGNGWNEAMKTFSKKDGSTVGFGFRLDFSFPLQNNQAKGSYLQNKAALENQEIAAMDLERTIDLTVSSAINDLNNTIFILKKSEESLGYYREAYTNEQVKFQNGMTTLLNLILFQERLTFAQIELVQAKQQFAIAVLSLRYATGTLLRKEKDNTLILHQDIFYTTPDTNQ